MQKIKRLNLGRNGVARNDNSSSPSARWVWKGKKQALEVALAVSIAPVPIATKFRMVLCWSITFSVWHPLAAEKMENIKHKKEQRERTIASRFQQQFGVFDWYGSHGSVSQVTVRMVLTARFHEPRFAWFSRFVSRATVRMLLTVRLHKSRFACGRCSIYVR